MRHTAAIRWSGLSSFFEHDSVAKIYFEGRISFLIVFIFPSFKNQEFQNYSINPRVRQYHCFRGCMPALGTIKIHVPKKDCPYFFGIEFWNENSSEGVLTGESLLTPRKPIACLEKCMIVHFMPIETKFL